MIHPIAQRSCRQFQQGASRWILGGRYTSSFGRRSAFQRRNSLLFGHDVIGRGLATTSEARKEVSSFQIGVTTSDEATSIETQSQNDALRKLVELSRPEWPLIAMSIATLGITSSVTMLLPFSAGQVIDYTIQHGQSGVSPMILASGLLGLTTLSAGGVYLRTVWLGRAGNRIVARLKQKLLESLLRQEVEFLSKTSTGDLLSRLSSDTGLVQATLTTQVVAGLRNTIMTFGSVGMLVYTSPALATVACCTLPPVFILTRYFGKSLQEQQRIVQKEQGIATALAQQALTNVATVQQFVAEDYETKRYHNAIAMAHTKAVGTTQSQAVLESVAFVAANGAVLGVLGYGGTLVLEGSISAGDLSGFVMYSLLMAGNVTGLSSLYGEVLRALAAAQRIFEILERVPSIQPNKPLLLTGTDPLQQLEALPSVGPDQTKVVQDPLLVEFENVHFSYPGRPDVAVLQDFTLTIQPGESVALVGGSGSGKSTVAALLTRLYDVSGGIRINGQPIDEFDPHVMRQMIGMVSQQPTLISGTIRDNILYGSWSKFATKTQQDEAVEASARMAHVLEFADNFPDRLDTVVGTDGSQLSGGQRQRIAIARVLLKNPPLVIFDEATASLDAKSESAVHEAMTTMMKGRTVLSIAHRLSTIRIASRILVIKHGQVVQSGSYDELSGRSGPFTDLMKTQLMT